MDQLSQLAIVRPAQSLLHDLTMFSIEIEDGELAVLSTFSLRPFRDRGLERGGDRGVVSDRPILPKPDNQQIWIGPGLCLLVLVNSSNYPDFLRLLFAMARDVLLAGNATTVPADESHSCLSATAVLSADDFSLDSGAD
jgi:hypothetical protein